MERPLSHAPASPPSADAHASPTSACGTAHAGGGTGADEPHLLAAVMETEPCEDWPIDRVRDTLRALGNPSTWSALFAAGRRAVEWDDLARTICKRGLYAHESLYADWRRGIPLSVRCGNLSCVACGIDAGHDRVCRLAALIDTAEGRS